MADVLGLQRAVPNGSPEPRDPLDCWACAVLVTAQNLLVAAFNLLLLALVLGTILLPAVTMLSFGFLCHSQVSGRPRVCGEYGCGVYGPQLLAWAVRLGPDPVYSFCAPRHPLALRTCGTRASRPCWSPDSCYSCRCSSSLWPATAASACASIWPTASCPTAEPFIGAGAPRSCGKSGPHQGPRPFPRQERYGFEDPRVKNNPDECPPFQSAQRLEAWGSSDLPCPIPASASPGIPLANCSICGPNNVGENSPFQKTLSFYYTRI